MYWQKITSTFFNSLQIFSQCDKQHSISQVVEYLVILGCGLCVTAVMSAPTKVCTVLETLVYNPQDSLKV